MRVPKNATSSTSNIRYVHIEKPIIIPRLPVITNDKQRVKLVKKIEQYCRQSMEYKDLIAYLRKHVDMNECTFLNNFKAGKNRGMIEIHHAPYTLFSIVDTVMKKHEECYGYVDEYKVAEEVMRIHYCGLIGLIPLSITCHQLVHDDKLTIPLWCVYGKFVEFTKQYHNWMSEQLLMSLEEQMQLSIKFRKNPQALKEANKILDVQFVYFDVEGETPMEVGVEAEDMKFLA